MVNVQMPWSLPLCPAPPAWRIDWDGAMAMFPWLQQLAGVPQDPEYHAEGDVLTHTRMVAEAMAAMPAWQALPEHQRSILFLAALLHDIGKPSTTQHEPDGHISSRGHARRGAQLARQLLWSSEGVGAALPFAAREAVVALVRMHGLPLWFVEKDDPDRAVFAASYRASLAHVALLAEADARGRICPDQDDLIGRVDLFRDVSAEHGCLTAPRPFPSDHSRVRYFRMAQADPSYHAYDETWGEVLLLSGLPGAGKDTWLHQHAPDLPVVSLDAIRRQLGVDPGDSQGAVVQAAKEQARELLRRRQPFAWNATNITRQLRDPLIDMLLAYGARCRVVYLDAPLPTVLRRNRERAASVPQSVILRLVGKLDLPDLTEAHAVEYLAQG